MVMVDIRELPSRITAQCLPLAGHEGVCRWRAMKARPTVEGVGLAFFKCGRRLLVEVPPEKEFQRPGPVLYFAVDDIDRAYADLRERGVAFRDEPHLIARMPDHEL